MGARWTRNESEFILFEMVPSLLFQNIVDSEKTGAFRCATFNASDQRQIAVGDFLGKMSIIDLENHSKVVK